MNATDYIKVVDLKEIEDLYPYPNRGHLLEYLTHYNSKDPSMVSYVRTLIHSSLNEKPEFDSYTSLHDILAYEERTVKELERRAEAYDQEEKIRRTDFLFVRGPA